MLSRGSAIKYVNQFTNAESGVEYCRVWTKDKSYLNYSDTMKKSGGVRKFESSVYSNAWNLNIYPNSNGNGSFDSGSTNMARGKNGFYAKKYMFSVENLAWKTSNTPGFTYNDLPYCERGSNGGRIMWFPPYDLKVSEQNSANWESNKFLGRPEPVYTYNNAERSGNISFRVIVDHPSILNLLVQHHFKGMSDEETDNYINAFFAGCEEIDFYGLVRKYTTLTPNDVKAIQSYLNNGKDPNTILRYTTLIDPVQDMYTPKNDDNKKTINTQLWFKNDCPKRISETNELYSSSQEDYQTLYNQYIAAKTEYFIYLNKGLTILTGGTWSQEQANDYNCLVRETSTTRPSDSKLSSMITTSNQAVDEGFNTLVTNYDYLTKALVELKEQLRLGAVQDIHVTLGSRTSSIAEDHYNLDLAYRRSHSVLVDILNKISTASVDTSTLWNNAAPKATDTKKDIVKPLEISLADLSGNKDLTGKFIVEYASNVGEQPIGSSNGTSNSDCTNKYLIKTSKELKMTAPNTFWCRETNVGIDYTVRQKTDTPVRPSEPTRVPVEVSTGPAVQNTTPPLDEMKKIVMRTLSECYYFKKLEEDSPVQFSSLKEKLRYFHPAFHSMTPEGLNSRLTFLHQCLRPGDTIPIKGSADYSDLNARNTTFGPPPICVLRIGDFYHSKIVIKDVNIDFEEGLWDLNPEGIGVQPMMAKVTLQVYFIGGHGLEKPVERLQNALSSNFYANTEMYDPRATATEDRSKFTKEFLNLLVNPTDNKETANKSSQEKPNTNIEQGSYIGVPSGAGLAPYGGSAIPMALPKSFNYSTLIDSLFTKNQVYFSNFISAYNNNIGAYGKKISSMVLSPVYRTNYQYEIDTSPSTKDTIDFIGEYPKGMELEVLVSDFRTKMLDKIKTENISTIFGFNKDMTDKLLANSEDILKPYVLKTTQTIIDGITRNPIDSVVTSRNAFIKELDKVNFLVNTLHDGSINGDVYSGVTLNGYTYDIIYNEYSNIVAFIKEYNTYFTEDLDTSFVFNKQTVLTTADLSYFLSELLKFKKEEIWNLYKARKDVFGDRVITDIGKRLDKFLVEKPKDNEFTKLKKNYPIRKHNKPVTFTVLDYNYSFTDNQKTMLTNVYKTSNNKTRSTLNYFR